MASAHSKPEAIACQDRRGSPRGCADQRSQVGLEVLPLSVQVLADPRGSRSLPHVLGGLRVILQLLADALSVVCVKRWRRQPPGGSLQEIKRVDQFSFICI